MGFDVSSSTIGWCVIDISKSNKLKLYDSGYFKPSKNGSIFERLIEVKEEISSLLNNYKPEQVAIEDIAQFMPKVSSANTIITLALYNRMVGLTIFENLKKSPELFSVMTIRHGLKQTKELPKKEEIPELVEKLLNINIPAQYTKSGKIKPERYDEADAIACGLYFAYKLTKQLDIIRSSRKDNGYTKRL